jgi:hypothetical protein
MAQRSVEIDSRRSTMQRKERISLAREHQEPQMEIGIVGLKVLRQWLQRIGPYIVAEVLLPGGTLVALSLYLYRRRQLAAARS